MGLSLIWNNPIKRGNQFLGNITERCPDWQQITRRIGGWWTATTPYLGSREELDEIFFDGLMRDVHASRDGFDIWQGFLGGMTYVRDGLMWNLSIDPVANAVKALYTRLGDNLLTNGGAESGAWTAVNGATVTQSTEWVNEGQYSCKIVVADTTIRGADIEVSLTIVAGQAYEANVKLNVLSGSWRVAINRTDTDASLDYYSTAGQTGDLTATLHIEASNTYAGTVRFRITSEAAAGTIYGDGARLAVAAAAAETGWQTDTLSIDEYGRKEAVLLLPGMSSAAAHGKVLTDLNAAAWPVTEPSGAFSNLTRDFSSDGLWLSFFGYIFTLRWRIIAPPAAAGMSSLIQSLVAQQSDYLAAGVIETNAMEFQIDDRAPLSLWKMARVIAQTGDEAGHRWALGVYGDRHLNYEQVRDEVAYHVERGRIYSPAGGELEAYLAMPGWAQFDDAPRGPANLSGLENYVTQRTYIEEIEYRMTTNPDGSKIEIVSFHPEASGE